MRYKSIHKNKVSEVEIQFPCDNNGKQWRHPGYPRRNKDIFSIPLPDNQQWFAYMISRFIV